ncbi:reprolysin-like metallopeptidase [Pseudomonas putida]|uniref:Metallopeptidase n=1 Tax=Pseudomonas putida TaxID=303 RepID=A0A6I6XR85_PSEPU|nr:zinc-dependent metalloprotease family protein [Pseudomonas putida]QHG68109.2 metallopeptidase [Pseudomonas putida]
MKLFEVLDSKKLSALKVNPEVAPYLNTLINDRANVEVLPILITTSLVSPDTQAMTIPLSEKETVTFQLRGAEPPAPDMVGWVGDVAPDRRQRFTLRSEMDFDPLKWISLVREGEKVVGNIHVDGRLYRLDYVGDGKHVLIKVDESKLPPEAEPLLGPDSGRKDPAVGKQPQSAHSTIRVLLVSTLQSRAANPNYRMPFAQALQDANLYMKNSNVAITYELAGFYDADYDETGRAYFDQLNDMRLAKPFGPDLLRVRDALRADLVSMYSTAREYCGQAWLNASKAQGHSVVSCFGSLAHELGHNIGADHNWHEGDPVRNPPYMYGYRYQAGTPRFSTQMSYACNPACPRIPYHSNPDVTYEGIPVGTREHHDVARRFNDRREVVANFYPNSLSVALSNSMRTCEFEHDVGGSSAVADKCDFFADKQIGIVTVVDVPEGVSFAISEGGKKWRSYRAKTFLPSLLVTPLKADPAHYPNVEIIEGGEAMTGHVTTVSSSFGE